MQPNGFNISDLDFWKEQLRLQELSGLSQVDFCKKQSLKLETFKYAKARTIGAISEKRDKKMLLPVKTVSTPSNTNQKISIVTVRGTKIECSVDTDPQWLGLLLAKLNA